MLVLSRKKGERIQIDDAITLVVLAVTGKTIRLGIEAPGDVPIRRTEVSLRFANQEQVHELETCSHGEMNSDSNVSEGGVSW